MYLIVGLGNPENEYENTRHNMGFDTINMLAEKFKISVMQSKFEGLYGKGIIHGEKVVLLKPQTYMNLSGESLIKFKNFYKIEDSKIIVIYDDMDTEKGRIRIREKGGPGNHNGMKSVIEHLKTEDFPRIRIGIGNPEKNENVINYVLGKTKGEERDILKEGIKKACLAIEEIMKSHIGIAMNKYN